ncbi:hypothetical protein WOLCODRAFT_158190 [Wolfiporia cocos MD-104 SS10]|uniref:Uncharacterized protein n=1 Tax=Wolfiporia cocos (strain MD-104) TaxID=742152 RepID=A0A2H3J5F5_WOLCO|nr:hypothetical protein WOLCODRAFT_158190 [Wolfiporia cocos MD-104 SS10]
MPRCPELRNLPKAGKLKSLNFKRTTPGTVGPLCGSSPTPTAGHLDPDHPASKLSRSELWRSAPKFKTDALMLRAYPQAVLYRLHNPWPDPPHSSAPRRAPDARRLNMSIMKVMGKAIHKSSVVRSKVGLRIKTAVALIVTRGADVRQDAKGRERIVFDGADAGPKWLMQDWTYIVHPTLEIYRMPYQTLIPQLREALKSIKETAEALEEKWSRATKLSQTKATFVLQDPGTSRGIKEKSLRARLPLPVGSPTMDQLKELGGLTDDMWSDLIASGAPAEPDPETMDLKPQPLAALPGQTAAATNRPDISSITKLLRSTNDALPDDGQNAPSTNTPMPQIFFPSRFNTDANSQTNRGPTREGQRSRETQEQADPGLKSATDAMQPAMAKLFKAKPVIKPANERPSKKR